MSRSEQLHDTSMDEILASIRKIITDDGQEAPDPDAFASAALDDFREVGAVLARGRSGGYMHDLTQALVGAPLSQNQDDDILDRETPDEAYTLAASTVVDSPSAPAPQPVAAAGASVQDDDDDLFLSQPVVAAPAPLVVAAPVTVETDDDDIIEDLGEPIMLGPEVELVEPVEAMNPAAVAVVAVTEPVAGAPSKASAAPAAAIEVAPQVIETAPPPPPPVVGAPVDETGAPSEMIAETPEAAEAVAAESAAKVVAEPTLADARPAIEEPPSAVQPAAEAAPAEANTPSQAAASEAEPVAAEVTADPEPPVVAETRNAEAATEDIATSEPAVEAAPPSLADAAPTTETAPSTLQPIASEEVMAAMLKPMLKEWLDTNMPGIVAKAMGGKDDTGTPSA